MNYEHFMARLNRRGFFRIKPGLERVHAVLLSLGNPQNAVPVIHIAGTNGKGSVAAYLESTLRHAGLRTGLYTSPHLWDVRERIQIGRQPVDLATFWAVAQQVLKAEQRTATTLTYFEFLTVMAYVAFSQQAVDVAIIEVGMGGRWDATNVVAHPILTLITSIGLDHTQWLGRTLQAIARQKAGIIKTGTPLISGARGTAARVIEKAAAARHAPIQQIDKDFHGETQTIEWRKRQRITYNSLTDRRETFELGLLGGHQTDNAAIALAGLEVLKQNGWAIPSRAIHEGFANVHWPGRLQLVRTASGRTILFDGAHNPPAIEQLVETLAHSPWAHTAKTFVFGVYRDKDYRRMLKQLRPHAQKIVMCTLPGKRALSAQAAAAAIKTPTTLRTAGDPRKAFDLALQISSPNDLIVVTGSLNLVGTLLHHVENTSRFELPTISLSKTSAETAHV